VRDYLYRKPEPKGFPRVDSHASQAHRLGLSNAHDLRQSRAHARAGKCADAAVRVGEQGSVGGHNPVAREGEFQPTGDGSAIDRGYYGFRQPPNRAENRADTASVCAGVSEGVHVKSGAEGRIGARDDSDRQVGVSCEGLERGAELLGQPRVKRVA
jgi:hypothetical protein